MCGTEVWNVATKYHIVVVSDDSDSMLVDFGMLCNQVGLSVQVLCDTYLSHRSVDI